MIGCASSFSHRDGDESNNSCHRWRKVFASKTTPVFWNVNWTRASVANGCVPPSKWCKLMTFRHSPNEDGGSKIKDGNRTEVLASFSTLILVTHQPRVVQREPSALYTERSPGNSENFNSSPDELAEWTEVSNCRTDSQLTPNIESPNQNRKRKVILCS